MFNKCNILLPLPTKTNYLRHLYFSFLTLLRSIFHHIPSDKIWPEAQVGRSLCGSYSMRKRTPFADIKMLIYTILPSFRFQLTNWSCDKSSYCIFTDTILSMHYEALFLRTRSHSRRTTKDSWKENEAEHAADALEMEAEALEENGNCSTSIFVELIAVSIAEKLTTRFRCH